MNFLDVAILVFLVWAGWKGFRKGLIIELASLVAIALGIYGSIEFSGFTADYLREQTEINESYLSLLAFSLTFGIIVTSVHLLAKVLEKFVNLIMLKLVNKLAGLIFSVVKYCLILSVLFYFFELVDVKMNIMPDKLKQEAILYEPIAAFVPSVFPLFDELPIPNVNFEDAKEILS